MELRDYQKEAVIKTIEVLKEKKNPLIIMATGLGKTIIFSEIARRIAKNNKKNIIIAHREELIDQAINKIYNQSGIIADKEKAKYFANTTSKVIVASVQSLKKERLHRFPNDFRLLTIDEAHHAPAKSYKQIINYFSTANVLGVTATPDRADNKQLGDIFDEIAYEYPLHKAIRDNWLVKIIGKKVTDFDIDLRGLNIVRGDYTDKDLAAVMINYIKPIAINIKEQTEGLKTMIFMPNVESSRLLAEELNRIGLKAAYLFGGHKTKERKKVLYDFSHGNITHLASCNLFLEGFDEPSVEAIVMLRPTTSRPLYAQVVGRGTRLHPGKESLLLVEFTYNSDKLKLVTPFELFATAGYEEKIRKRAEKLLDENGTDLLETLDKTRERYYSLLGVKERLIVKKYNFVAFDPFATAELVGEDISGEFDIHYNGKKLTGHITMKQAEILSRYNIVNLEKLTKAQASKLIDILFNKGYKPYFGPATPAQKRFLTMKGWDSKNMTKAQAAMLISRIKKGELNGRNDKVLGISTTETPSYSLTTSA